METGLVENHVQRNGGRGSRGSTTQQRRKEVEGGSISTAAFCLLLPSVFLFSRLSPPPPREREEAGKAAPAPSQDSFPSSSSLSSPFPLVSSSLLPFPSLSFLGRRRRRRRGKEGRRSRDLGADQWRREGGIKNPLLLFLRGRRRRRERQVEEKEAEGGRTVAGGKEAESPLRILSCALFPPSMELSQNFGTHKMRLFFWKRFLVRVLCSTANVHCVRLQFVAEPPSTEPWPA